jgi:hypothetical protein
MDRRTASVLCIAMSERDDCASQDEGALAASMDEGPEELVRDHELQRWREAGEHLRHVAPATFRAMLHAAEASAADLPADADGNAKSFM